jgi:hypothetical protein
MLAKLKETVVPFVFSASRPAGETTLDTRHDIHGRRIGRAGGPATRPSRVWVDYVSDPDLDIQFKAEPKRDPACRHARDLKAWSR